MNNKNGVTNKLIIPRRESKDNIGFASTADTSPFEPIRHKVIIKTIPISIQKFSHLAPSPVM